MSKIMDFSISGDVHEMNAVFKNGDKISFILDSDVYKVNGVARTAEAASFLVGSDGDVYVPVNVFNGSFDGVTLERKARGKKIKYLLNIASDFKAAFNKDEPVVLPDMTALIPKAEPENDFICDLSEYEKYMNPENPDEYIKLINKAHPLDASYIPPDLTNISYTRRDGRAIQQMREAL